MIFRDISVTLSNHGEKKMRKKNFFVVFRSIRSCASRQMEGNDWRGRQDDEGGDHVRRRLHRRGEGHDEVAAQQSRSALRSLLKESTHLYHHRIYEGNYVNCLLIDDHRNPHYWKLIFDPINKYNYHNCITIMITFYLSYILIGKIINQFNARFSAWQFTPLLATFKNDVMLRRWNDAWHHHSGLPRNVVSRTTQLHPSRPRGKKLSRRLRKYRQGKKSKKVSNKKKKF